MLNDVAVTLKQSDNEATMESLQEGVGTSHLHWTVGLFETTQRTLHMALR